jgi:aerobic-type carbon monoxide dehydrogenase small subunit (CoxS/CutS family)
MNQDIEPGIELICPVCGQTMTYLHRIKRAFNGDRDVFQCGSCKVSMTRAVEMAPAA